MESSSPRGVRFQDGTEAENQEIDRNKTPVPRGVTGHSGSPSTSSVLRPTSPRPRNILPSQPAQQQQIGRSTGHVFYPLDIPIDPTILPIVEEGGFPFEMRSPMSNQPPYSWTPLSATTPEAAYYQSSAGQYFPNYEQDSAHNESDRSPTSSGSRNRPGFMRLPSNTYLPVRHPETGGHDQHNTSGGGGKVIQAYVRRGLGRTRQGKGRPTRQGYASRISDPDDDYLQHSSAGSYRRENSELESFESEEGSVADEYDDEFDVERQLNSLVDFIPSAEDLANPEYVERLQWQSRLGQVLSGDVVTSEKKRISEPSGPEDEKAHRFEMWLGIRAKAYGRSVADQRRVLFEGRAQMDRMIDEVLSFSVKSFEEDARDAKTAEEQVDEILARWDRYEALYSSREALMADKPATAEGSEFELTLSALVAWSNVTKNVRTSLQILRAWTGQQDLDLTRRGGPSTATNASAPNINDESSFIERILKENRIEQTFSKDILSTLNKLVYKAKETIQTNHTIFERLKLPSFLRDVQLLVNFPTKLIEEALRIRLAFARKLREPGLIVIEQLIDDFASCMLVAVGIKKEYLSITSPTEGWNLVSWVDDSFDAVLLEALKFYFRLLMRKLDNRTEKVYFKDAEILEHQWDFLNVNITKYIEGGDAVLAEQFRFPACPTLITAVH
jgi:mitogen-activated protein kinase kinase kinase